MNVDYEVPEAFRREYALRNRAFHPDLAAVHIAAMLGFGNQKHTDEIEEILYTPGVELYSDVFPFLQKVYSDPGKFAKIWTQGQVSEGNHWGYQEAKIKMSGLDVILHTLADHRKDEENPALYSIYENKCEELEPELEALKPRFRKFAFIDDKASNLLHMQEICEKLGISAEFIQIHRSKEEKANDLRFSHITSLNEINIQDIDMFFIDMDDTCIDHGLVKRLLTDRLMMWFEQQY